MTADLQVFAFEGAEVRAFIADDGTGRFVAADVCAILGHSNHRKAVRDLLDDDEWETVSAGRADRNQGVRSAFQPGRGGAHRLVVVTEPGVYGLVFRSEVPGARAFRRWLAHDVLPAIRRTGVYATPEVNRELAAAVASAGLAIASVLASSHARAVVRYADGGVGVAEEDREAEIAQTRALVDALQHLDTLARRFPAAGAIEVPATVAALARQTHLKAMPPVVEVDPWKP